MTNASTKRDRSWQRLGQAAFDVLVVGGGIVGSGVARDAAMRGLSVALVDQQDFAAGTSSRSSRLLHGGIRYLEQGHLGLVREASVEKAVIHRIAPHLAEPLRFIFPAARDHGRRLWQLRLGVKIYDWLCGRRNFEPSRGLSREEVLRMLPTLASENLAGAVSYLDAFTNDARLVIDTLRSAERHGVVLLNYVRFCDARRVGKVWNSELEDRASGARGTVRSRAIVNATGPWADKIPHSQVKLRLSKGIHIVIERERLPVPCAVVLPKGKRILFVLPWAERVIIGTTETDYSGAPDGVRTAAEDIDYLIQAVNAFFPAVPLRRSDIVSHWAGVRPLIATAEASISDISRAHQIQCPEPGWWDIAGGKLTTYRLMAEQTTDQIVQHLGVRVKPCRTAQEPLLPLDEPNPFSRIRPPAQSADAVEHYVAEEWAFHLEDVLLRRGGWAHYDRLPPNAVMRLARWMAAAAGWSSERERAELDSWQSRFN